MDILSYCIQLDKNKKSFAFIYQVKKDNMIDKIIEVTNFINDDRISARVFCILNDITTQPLCECGNALKFNQYSKGFFDFCSVKCSSNSKSKQDKIKQTNILKFGHINAFHSQNGRKEWNSFISDSTRVQNAVEKGKETLKQNYDVDTIEEAQKIRVQNALNANIKKYGYAYNNREQAMKNRNEEKIQEKYRETCLNKYGVPSTSQVPEIFEKTQKKLFCSKNYTLPSGKIIKVRGYEPFALDNLLLSYSENEITTETSKMPKIFYIGTDGKKHRYFPDIFIPAENKIIEVKSTYTMKANYHINLLKQQACLDMGLDFEFQIFNDKGGLI